MQEAVNKRGPLCPFQPWCIQDGCVFSDDFMWEIVQESHTLENWKIFKRAAFSLTGNINWKGEARIDLYDALRVNVLDRKYCPQKFKLYSFMYVAPDLSETSLSIIPSILSCLPLNWTCFISFIPAVGSQCWGITFISVSFIARWVQSIYLMRESWRGYTEKPTAPLPCYHFTSVTQLMQNTKTATCLLALFCSVFSVAFLREAPAVIIFVWYKLVTSFLALEGFN